VGMNAAGRRREPGYSGRCGQRKLACGWVRRGARGRLRSRTTQRNTTSTTRPVTAHEAIKAAMWRVEREEGGGEGAVEISSGAEVGRRRDRGGQGWCWTLASQPEFCSRPASLLQFSGGFPLRCCRRRRRLLVLVLLPLECHSTFPDAHGDCPHRRLSWRWRAGRFARDRPGRMGAGAAETEERPLLVPR